MPAENNQRDNVDDLVERMVDIDLANFCDHLVVAR